MWIWIRIMGDLLDPDLYKGRRGSRIRIRITTNADPDPHYNQCEFTSLAYSTFYSAWHPPHELQ